MEEEVKCNIIMGKNWRCDTAVFILGQTFQVKKKKKKKKLRKCHL